MVKISENHIYISDDTSKSLQMRLREAISAGIWEGRFAPGDRMPATRALAQYLRIARITVSLAYEELTTDGYLVASARSGFYVSPDAPSLAGSGLSAPAQEAGEPQGIDWSARLGAPVQAVGPQAKPPDWREYRYPFIFGQADLPRFPLDEWRACARQALGKQSFPIIAGDFGDRDDPMLVEQIVRRSLPGRSISAPTEQVLVTLGAQHAMWLIVQALFAGRPGVRVAVEEPGYPELRYILRFVGVEAAPVPVDREGIVPELIPEGVEAVFVTPSHQAPTGVTMTMARREALLGMAEARDFVVVEDDYDFEMSYLRPHSPALKSLDRRGRVLYVGSFSKSLFPGLRLGYLSAPEPLIARARAIRTLAARHPPGLTQRAAAHFLSLGHYNAHARNLRVRMAKRRRTLLDALARHGLSPTQGNLFGGATLWLEGPEDLRATPLAEALKTRGVLIEPGRPFFAEAGASDRWIRLGFAAIPDDRIAEGVRLIAEEMARQRSAPAPADPRDAAAMRSAT